MAQAPADSAFMSIPAIPIQASVGDNDTNDWYFDDKPEEVRRSSQEVKQFRLDEDEPPPEHEKLRKVKVLGLFPVPDVLLAVEPWLLRAKSRSDVLYAGLTFEVDKQPFVVVLCDPQRGVLTEETEYFTQGSPAEAAGAVARNNLELQRQADALQRGEAERLRT